MEKTIFTKDEIRDYLYKLSREIHGESMLLPSMNTLTDPELMEKILSSTVAYADFVSELSRKQGVIEGKVGIILRMVEYFDLKEKDE